MGLGEHKDCVANSDNGRYLHDMKSPSQIAWDSWGRPEVRGVVDIDGCCWLCGAHAVRGAPDSAGVAKTFLDHRRCLGEPGVVCAACMAAMSKRQFSIEGAGKAAPTNLSHWYGAGVYEFGSKGDKGRMREFLLRDKVGPWFASIADSGQKHLLPFAQMNPGGGVAGRVIFETEVVTVPTDAGDDIARIVRMLDAGVSKSCIASGDYYPRQIMKVGEEAIEEFEAWASPLRGSGWFDLAVWISQKEG